MLMRISKIALICSCGFFSAQLAVCYAESGSESGAGMAMGAAAGGEKGAAVSASKSTLAASTTSTTTGKSPVTAEASPSGSSAYERRLVDQISEENIKNLQMADDDEESARMMEAAFRMSIPSSYFDVSKLRVEYLDNKGQIVPTVPGELNNLFVLRGTLRNNHERFRAVTTVLRVTLKDCDGSVCKTIATTACRAQYAIPITSEVSVDIPLVFPSKIKLRGAMTAEVGIVESWGQIEPSIMAKEMEELEAMEAEEERERSKAQESKI
jgi:hypothetical protein